MGIGSFRLRAGDARGDARGTRAGTRGDARGSDWGQEPPGPNEGPTKSTKRGLTGRPRPTPGELGVAKPLIDVKKSFYSSPATKALGNASR